MKFLAIFSTIFSLFLMSYVRTLYEGREYFRGEVNILVDESYITEDTIKSLREQLLETKGKLTEVKMINDSLIKTKKKRFKKIGVLPPTQNVLDTITINNNENEN